MKHIINISIVFIVSILFMMCSNRPKTNDESVQKKNNSPIVDSVEIPKEEPIKEVEEVKIVESSIVKKLNLVFKKKLYNHKPQELVHYKGLNVIFEKENWLEVQNAYEVWRQQEINSGTYVHSCGNSAEEFANKPYRSRYALPIISENLNTEMIDTLMVDINYDDIQDVIFKIRPIDCLEGNGASADAAINLLIASNANKYEVIENSILTQIERVLKKLRKDISTRDHQWIEFDKAANNKGIITILGNSSIYLDDDPSCCSSIECKFTSYIDLMGKGYIDIDVTHKDKFDDLETFYKLCVRLL